MAINKKTGTLAAYAHLILHSALAFSLRDSRSRPAVERIGTQITQTNEPQGDKHVEIKERLRSRKNTKERKKNKTKVHNNHNIKSKGWSCGETLIEKPRKEKKNDNRIKRPKNKECRKGKDQHGHTDF